MVNINKISLKDYPTTRESVSVYSQSIPIDKTLTTLNTVEDIINLDDFNRPAYNLLVNPLFKTTTTADIDGWFRSNVNYEFYNTSRTINPTLGGSYTIESEYGGSMARINKNSRFPALSCLYQDIVNPTPGRYVITLSHVGRIEASFNFFRTFAIVAINGDSSTLTGENSYNFTNVYFNNNIPKSTTLITANSRVWTTSTLSHTVPYNTDITRIHIAFILSDANQRDLPEDGFYVDAIQMEPDFGTLDGTVSSENFSEQNPTSTGIIDPFSERYSRFLIENSTDTEYNTRSLREKPIDNIKYVNLYARSGDVYIDFDRDASRVGSNKGIYLREGETFSQPVNVNNRISFINPIQCPAPRVVGYVMG